jgi:uncharacterized membrane protein (UPF0127 family)
MTMESGYRAVRVQREGEAIAELHLLAAFDMLRRARGLLGRPQPLPGQGVWLKPCNAVHCWFMGYAIDVLFLDGEGRVLKLCSQLLPWRMAACRGARSVVELAGGEAERLKIAEGDVITCVA